MNLRLFFYSFVYNFVIVIAENKEEASLILNEWAKKNVYTVGYTNFKHWNSVKDLGSSDYGGDWSPKLKHEMKVEKGVYPFYHANE